MALAADSISQPVISSGVTRLVLSRFRNYTTLDVPFAPIPVVLTGMNGAGKTNILEALSLLSPGRGLRHTKLSEMTSTHVLKQAAGLSWSVAVELSDSSTLGTGLDFTANGAERRLVKANSQPLKSQGALTDWLNVVWVTPQMGQLFMEGASERRKFIDRFAFAIDPAHSDRLHRYDHHLRQRTVLLKEGAREPSWLDILERRLAEDAIAITATRQSMVKLLNLFSEKTPKESPFPRFCAKMQGSAEFALENAAALEAEETLHRSFFESRALDAKVGGSAVGCHRSDLCVMHMSKGIPAGVPATACSTGEQKILLLALVLAFARIQTGMQPQTTLLLLDDVAAHLDDRYRTALFGELCSLDESSEQEGSRIQTWMTGTDPSDFYDLRPYAQFYSVVDATLNNG